MKIIKNKRLNKGFTIVELLVVITIIGVLSTFVSVGYFGYVKQSKESLVKAEAHEIYKALEIAVINEQVDNCDSVEDLELLESSELVTILETKCGMNLPDDSTLAFKDGVLTYTSRGETATYNYGN